MDEQLDHGPVLARNPDLEVARRAEDAAQALEEVPQLSGVGQRQRADLARLARRAVLLPDHEAAVGGVGHEDEAVLPAVHPHLVPLADVRHVSN